MNHHWRRAVRRIKRVSDVEMACADLEIPDLVLPEPPSANRYWRHAQGRTYKSPEARRYQVNVKARAMVGRLKPIKGPVSISLTWYRSAKRGDLDNRIKVILDALQGSAYLDDSQVVELYARREEDKLNPRVEVTVKEAA